MKTFIYLIVTFFVLVSPLVLSQQESTKVINGWRSFDSTGIRSFLGKEGSRTYQSLKNIGPPEKGYLTYWNQHEWLKNYEEYPIIPDSFEITCKFISSKNVTGVWIGLGLEDSLWVFSGYRELIVMDSTMWQTVKFDMNYSIKTFMKNFGKLLLMIHITNHDSTEAQIEVAFDCISGIDDTLGVVVYDNFGNLTGISKNPESIPASFALSQNYPNPFNPSTKISYSLQSSETVTLRVYDVLGHEVAMLVNQYQSAGNYTASFDAGNLASGMYFYKLEAGSLQSIKKMMLLK